MEAPDNMQVFDRALVRRRRERAVAAGDAHDFLFIEAANRVADRLSDVTRNFPVALELGVRSGHMGRAAMATGRVGTLYASDASPVLAAGASVPAVAADEEALPFAPASLDLVISSLALHWVNDLPGALLQIRQALKPDGLFLAAMFGGETLTELRGTLMEAELAISGGVAPRVSPTADLRDAAGLLNRAGFALPVADRDSLTVGYTDAFALMRDLRGMGETNAVRQRSRTPFRRAVLAEAARLYQTRHAMEGGRVRATFEIIYLAGWAPAANQQKPMRPGAATTRLADFLGTVELPAGDLANPGKSSE